MIKHIKKERRNILFYKAFDTSYLWLFYMHHPIDRITDTVVFVVCTGWNARFNPIIKAPLLTEQYHSLNKLTITILPIQHKYSNLQTSIIIILNRVGYSSVVHYSVRSWCGSIPHGGPVELCLVPASAPRLVYQWPWYVLFSLWNGAYKIFLLLIENRLARVAVVGFVSHYRNCPLQYVRRRYYKHN